VGNDLEDVVARYAVERHAAARGIACPASVSRKHHPDGIIAIVAMSRVADKVDGAGVGHPDHDAVIAAVPGYVVSRVARAGPRLVDVQDRVVTAAATD
jgi:hypothetical protein